MTITDAASQIATAAVDETLPEPKWFGFFERGWRPAFAWELLLECMLLLVVLSHEIWTHDLDTLKAITEYHTFLEIYFSLRFAVIGVFGAGRTAEKISAVKAALATTK